MEEVVGHPPCPDERRWAPAKESRARVRHKPSRSTWHCRCGGDLAFISRVEDGRAIIDPMRLCGRFFPIPDARPVPLPADPERPCPLSSPLSCL